jgi:hypothetical protein
MPSKLVNVVLLIVMVVLDAAILATVSEVWMRLTLGLTLLVPIVLVSAHLELAEAFASMGPTQVRPRRFPALRANVNAFLTEVKRLNWLVVDLDRGFGREQATSAEIEACQQRMEALLLEIRKTAGKAAQEGGDRDPEEGARSAEVGRSSESTGSSEAEASEEGEAPDEDAKAPPAGADPGD